MKKMMAWKVIRIVTVCMLMILAANTFFSIKLAHQNIEQESKAMFTQIQNILSDNTIETEQVKADFSENCLVKARVAAYIIQKNPSILDSKKEIAKVAEMLHIDELHAFDKDGVIYAGSEPKYFGYSFESGEQLEFFKPMLEDTSLELCQPVTPNTAEGKLMQYAAVWREDRKGIIQIGLKPEHVIEVTRKNQLSYIFSRFVEEKNMELYAVDLSTKEILGSTEKSRIGQTLADIGIADGQLREDGKGFHAVIDGKRSYCIFQRQNNILIGSAITMKSLYSMLPQDTVLVILYLTLITVVMTFGILRYLDTYVIQGIHEVNWKLQKIAHGDWKEKVDVHTTEEFSELSDYINDMVKRIVDTNDEMISLLEVVQIPIVIYEYVRGTGHIKIFGRMKEMFSISEAEEKRFKEDRIAFAGKLEEMRRYPVSKDKKVFRLEGEEERYVRMESYVRDNGVFGVIMDVTKEMLEKQQLRRERDEDLLTGLCSRRAFIRRMKLLLEHPEELGCSALVGIDTDRLKMVNDTYGHDAGDSYLRGMADILRESTAPGALLGRLGGDEFAVWIYGCESREELESFIKELEEKQWGIYEVHFREEVSFSVRFSMGCAFYGEDGTDYESLTTCADSRMYENKRRKRQADEQENPDFRQRTDVNRYRNGDVENG